MSTPNLPPKNFERKKRFVKKMDTISFAPLAGAKVPKNKDIPREYKIDLGRVRRVNEQINFIIDGKTDKEKGKKAKKTLEKKILEKNANKNISEGCRQLIECMQKRFKEISQKNIECMNEGSGKDKEVAKILDKYKSLEKEYGMDIKTIKEISRQRKHNSLPKIERKDSFYNINITPTKVIKKLNLARLNENYRMKLNKAFLAFNPYTHNKNLNKLIKEDTEEKEKIDALKKKIDEDIKTITDKEYYTNKEIKVKEYLKKMRPFSSQLNGQGMNRTNSTTFKSQSGTQNNFNKNPKNNKTQKENKDYENLKKALAAASKIIDMRKIIDYIDSHSTLEDNQNSSIKDRTEIYFREIDDASRILNELRERGTKKQIEEKENLTRKNFQIQSDNFIELLKTKKRELMEFIEKNETEALLNNNKNK